VKRHLRPALTTALLALAAALLMSSGLLTAGAAPPPPAPASVNDPSGPAQAAPGAVTPLPDFKPSEELPADAAVAFPTDI